jgi:hypothetical protein
VALTRIITLVVLDARPAEHFVLDRPVAGDHVDAPAAAGDMIERRPEFRQVQWMPRAVQHMHGRDQHDLLGEPCQGRRRYEAVQRLAVEDAAIAALGQPLGQCEDQIEAEFLGPQRQGLVVVETPVGRPFKRRLRPAASLDRQEEAEENRLLERLRQGAFRKIGRSGEFWQADDRSGWVLNGHGWAPVC